MECIVHGVAKSRTQLSEFHLSLEKKRYNTCEQSNKSGGGQVREKSEASREG